MWGSSVQPTSSPGVGIQGSGSERECIRVRPPPTLESDMPSRQGCLLASIAMLFPRNVRLLSTPFGEIRSDPSCLSVSHPADVFSSSCMLCLATSFLPLFPTSVLVAFLCFAFRFFCSPHCSLHSLHWLRVRWNSLLFVIAWPCLPDCFFRPPTVIFDVVVCVPILLH